MSYDVNLISDGKSIFSRMFRSRKNYQNILKQELRQKYCLEIRPSQYFYSPLYLICSNESNINEIKINLWEEITKKKTTKHPITSDFLYSILQSIDLDTPATQEKLINFFKWYPDFVSIFMQDFLQETHGSIKDRKKTLCFEKNELAESEDALKENKDLAIAAIKEKLIETDNNQFLNSFLKKFEKSALKLPEKTLFTIAKKNQGAALKIFSSRNLYKKLLKEGNFDRGDFITLLKKTLLDKTLTRQNVDHILIGVVAAYPEKFLMLLPELNKIDNNPNNFVFHTDVPFQPIYDMVANAYGKNKILYRYVTTQYIKQNQPIPNEIAYLIVSDNKLWQQFYKPTTSYFLRLLPWYSSQAEIKRLQELSPLFNKKISQEKFVPEIQIQAAKPSPEKSLVAQLMKEESLSSPQEVQRLTSSDEANSESSDQQITELQPMKSPPKKPSVGQLTKEESLLSPQKEIQRSIPSDETNEELSDQQITELQPMESPPKKPSVGQLTKEESLLSPQKEIQRLIPSDETNEELSDQQITELQPMKSPQKKPSVEQEAKKWGKIIHSREFFESLLAFIQGRSSQKCSPTKVSPIRQKGGSPLSYSPTNGSPGNRTPIMNNDLPEEYSPTKASPPPWSPTNGSPGNRTPIMNRFDESPNSQHKRRNSWSSPNPSGSPGIDDESSALGDEIFSTPKKKTSSKPHSGNSRRQLYKNTNSPVENKNCSDLQNLSLFNFKSGQVDSKEYIPIRRIRRNSSF